MPKSDSLRLACSCYAGLVQCTELVRRKLTSSCLWDSLLKMTPLPGYYFPASETFDWKTPHSWNAGSVQFLSGLSPLAHKGSPRKSLWTSLTGKSASLKIQPPEHLLRAAAGSHKPTKWVNISGISLHMGYISWAAMGVKMRHVTLMDSLDMSSSAPYICWLQLFN